MQGIQGLGIAAQKADVARFATGRAVPVKPAARISRIRTVALKFTFPPRSTRYSRYFLCASRVARRALSAAARNARRSARAKSRGLYFRRI